MSEIELHRKLLGDSVRNDALFAALKRVIKPGMTVADIGAGTGFLSFLARQLGAKQCYLYEYSGALQLARTLARTNSVSGLTFVKTHSSEVRKPPKVDLAVSETLGNFALEENLLETLVDARRFLNPGGTLMPSALKQFVAPVIRPRLQHEIDVWPRVGFGMNLAAAREIGLNNMYVRTVRPDDLPGADAVHTWDYIDFRPGGEAPSSVRRSGVEWDRLGASTVHGFALWWEAELVPGISISTSPYAAPTHWEQIYLPLLESVTLQAGDTLDLQLLSDTRSGVRLAWNTRVLRKGRPVSSQAQDLRHGRL